MIVAADKSDRSDENNYGTLRVITQNDHAHLAAELLSLWRCDGLPEHPRRADLLFAAREHDNGWREPDAAPKADPSSGRPHDFVSLPHEDRRELWQRGVERFVEQQPYGSLLILEHARNLHRKLVDDDAWRVHLEGWRELGEELLTDTTTSPRELAADYRWIDLADSFSLALCHGIDELPKRHGYRGRLVDGAGWSKSTLQLDPFPLAGATTFTVPSRRIPDRPYRSDLDLAMELATARWGRTRFRITHWAEQAP